MAHRFPRLLPLLLATACAPAGPGPITPDQREAAAVTTPLAEPRIAAEDLHSFARPELARVRHVALDLTADFERHILRGTARLTIERAAGVNQVVLDARDLMIRRVRDAAGETLEHRLGARVEFLGRAVTVVLPDDGSRELDIVVEYETTPDAAAVQWLDPSQTAGGEKPYLFTQGQAILTRTWIPTQDSPGIRQTYSARIVVPEGLRAVMSAEMLTPEGEPAGDGVAYRFEMRRPIPAYLIALAIGDIEFRSLGPRSGVYAEPGIIDRAAHELADIERMMSAAEALYGPYRWDRYDVLVLPPSFPFGGMENPRLTFATPTILAGDRSLVSLIAHELAHSWSGNLVTNATWNDFWLNEGFTVYFERRIVEEVYGVRRAEMERVLGRASLLATIAELGPRHPDTRLQLDLAGRDPDVGLTDVAYEKGATFLETIEREVGRARFDGFLRAYFEAHAFEPMTSEAFVAWLDAKLIGDDDALRARIRPDQWVFGFGLPENAPAVSEEVFGRTEAAAAAFLSGTAPGRLRTDDWTTHEWLRFLGALPDSLSSERMAQLDREFRFSQSGNSEILFAWLRLAIDSRYEPAFRVLDRFLTTQGRRKFLTPLYSALMETGWGREMARDIYRRARPLYHAVSRGTIDRVVGWQGPDA
ncbi:MAG TPA: M1 family metallopeptidase [Longimicrobiales bacterium]|nr:M1 family metallopeptidase [Longimicrobiales bacterium]